MLCSGCSYLHTQKGSFCLIDTLRQLVPVVICSVSRVRAELERLHAGRTIAIVPLDYQDLSTDWADIINLIGEHNEEILCGELGLSKAELAALEDVGSV